MRKSSENTLFKIFLVIPPGLEIPAQMELNPFLPLLTPSSEGTPFEFECELETIYRLNLHLRIPTRILIRYAEFSALSFAELFDKSVRLPWNQYIRKDTVLNIRTTCRKSKLYHSDAVTQRIHEAIQSNLGCKLQLASSDDQSQLSKQQLIIVRLFHDHLTISIDSSGNPLYMRGYKQTAAKAPLRENLAAAIITASGWQPQYPLIDPFCGSGTIPIEAALIAKNQPPGLYRDFAFKNWHRFEQSKWHEIRKEIVLNSPPARSSIYGSDRDAGAVSAANSNALNARIDQWVAWSQQPFSAIDAVAGKGWLITNPPYGLRTESNRDIRDLYARFGRVIKNEFKGWHVVFLCPDRNLARQTQLKLKNMLTFSNGGTQVQAFASEID